LRALLDPPLTGLAGIGHDRRFIVDDFGKGGQPQPQAAFSLGRRVGGIGQLGCQQGVQMKGGVSHRLQPFARSGGLGAAVN